ncbi:MAG: caspase family protein [Chitinophagaceae bacterium]|nr:caspase family protein [Chitinophagaceae bacterium]
MFKWFVALTCFCVQQCWAQTYYQMQFNITQKGRQIPVTALFMLNADDSGFVRIRYVDRANQEDFIYQAGLREELISDDQGNYATDKVYYATVQPETWGNKEITDKLLPVFYFEKKTQPYIEPTAIYYANMFGVKSIDSSAQLTYRYLEEKDLNQKLLSRYFYEDEELLSAFTQNNAKGFSSKEKNMKIHLLLVADTTDPKIGNSCAMNIRYVENFYKGLAQYIGCPFMIRKVMGPSYNKNNVLSEIKLLLPSPDDIVIFYFSGHGYRKETDPRRFPYFDLRATDAEDYLTQTMNLEDVQTALLAKNARLTLVFSDCCNSYVGAENPIAAAPVRKKALSLSWNEQNVRSLYLDPVKKTIMATASDSTQYAFMANAFGGLFSFSLNNSLSSAVTKAAVSPTWFTILEAMRNETFRLSRRSDCSARLGPGASCYQVPAYRVR